MESTAEVVYMYLPDVDVGTPVSNKKDHKSMCTCTKEISILQHDT